MNLVFLDRYTLSPSNDLSMDRFASLGHTVFYDRTDPQQTAERIKDADIVFTNKVILSERELSQAPNLKYIGILSTGLNSVPDMEYVSRRGIVVCNVPEYSTNAVAQMTFAHILMFANQVGSHNDQVRQGAWQSCKDFCFYSPDLFELCGKTLGIIGYGAIGKKVAALAHAFDMNVLVFTRSPRANDVRSNLQFVSFERLLSDSDIISIHCPLTPQTHHMFSAETLSGIKPSCILINTARGAIVDQAAVANALKAGTLAGYGADVADPEPILADNPLLFAPRCHLTPHIAWASYETRMRLLNIAYENVCAYLSGNSKNQVNSI